MKKLLALVLALVMSMSLVTISNAAFKDADKIDYKEAVDVMNAVDVFVGDENGNFNAKANLTREQAAKIIAYLELGSKAADALVGSGTFADVAASRWSAGFVGYCAQAGVVAGVGDGKFDPAGQLTALQFGKMLLVELGYDAKAAGMVGADWAIATSKLMAKAKLMDKIDGSVNQVLTREKAAQMTLNALKAPTVEYTTKGSSISVNGAEINLGASEPTYVTNTIAKEQTISNEKLTNNGGYTIELGEKLYKDLKLVKNTTDAFERPTHEWYLKTTKVGAYAETADLEYTKAVNMGTIYSDLGLSKGISKTAVTYYVDGLKQTDAKAWANDVVKGSQAKQDQMGNGVLTQVWYDDDAKTLTIVSINTYIGTVTAAYPDTTTKDAYVKVKDMDGYGCPGTGKEFETESFKKNDVVAYTYSYKAGENSIQSMALAEKVTGAMSTYTISGNVTVGGTKYDANKMSVSTVKDTVAAVDKGDDVTIYLDANGYVLYVDADADIKYAVVLDYKTGVGDMNDQNKAKLLFTDGTTQTVEVALAAGQAPTTGNFTRNELSKINQYDIVAYTIGTDNVYDLTLASNRVLTAAGDATYGTKLVTNGKNTFENNATDMNVGETGNQVTTKADAATIFLVMTLGTGGKKDTFAAYKGFAEVPTITLAATKKTTMATFVDTDSTTPDAEPADVVFILDTTDVSVSSNNKDIIYIKGSDTDKSYTNALGHFYEYDCFVNGDTTATTIKTESQFTKDTLIYGPSYNSKGILIGQDAYVNADHTTGTDMAYGTTTDSVKNDVIKLGGVSYAYAKNVEVYFIDVDGKLVAGTIDEIAYDEDDMVFVKTDKDGLLTNVYIKVKDSTEVITPAPAAVAIVDGTPSVTIASGTVKTSTTGSMAIRNEDNTAGVDAEDVVITYEITTWDPTTNSYNAPMTFEKSVGDVAADTYIDADGAPISTLISSGVKCKVVVTVTSNVASKTFDCGVITST